MPVTPAGFEGPLVWAQIRGVAMLRINSNVAPMSIQMAMGRTQRDTERAMRELASGSRLVNPGADAAGLAIAENMRAHKKGFEAARYNADNAVSFVQLAEGAINEQNNILIRLRELAIQAASDTYSDTERKYLDNEFQQLTSELDRLARSTRFGSQGLLDGSTKEYEFHVGVHGDEDNIIRYKNDTDTTASNLDIDGLGVEDKSDARDSLKYIDRALVSLNESRAKLGAVQSRMEFATNSLDGQIQSLEEAHSKMSATDVASAISQVRRGQIMMQYQAAMLATANDSQQHLLRLVA